MDKQELKIEYLPLSEIKPYEKNAKLHPDAQIKQIIKSIIRPTESCVRK